MNKVYNIISRHSILLIYTIVFTILLYGVIMTSGSAHVGKMFVFYFSLLFSYIIFYSKLKGIRYFSTKFFLPFNKLKFNNTHIPLAVFSLTLLIGHLIYLKGSPALEALSIMKTTEVASLRRSITADSLVMWNYLASFNMKAIIPFTLLLLIIKKETYIYWVFFFITIFYSFSLMQKSYIITIIAPVLIYSIYKRKWILSIKYSFTCLAIIVGLVFIANPILRGGVDDALEVVVEDTSDVPYAVRVFIGIKKRVTIIPGKMVSDWFENIPTNKPYLNGNGYTFIAKLTGEEYHSYSLELYPVLYPKYAERGFKGSVNVASFMYEYSNFGIIGLIFSGVILAFIFFLIEMLFIDNSMIKICLNLFFLLILSSSSLTTTLFSGGWGLIIVLYYCFKKDLITEYE